VQQQVLDAVAGSLLAWDPVAKAPRWRVDHAGPWNGGILSTAGNLVFQGNANGQIVAYRADTGETVWQFDAQTGVVAPPATYRINGEQYVAVVAGWGGALPLVAGKALKSGAIPNRSRLLVFKLKGNASLPPAVDRQLVFNPPEQTASAEQVEAGKAAYLTYCVFCHGDGVVGGGVTPDLRAMTLEKHANWDAVVLGGLHWQNGMVGFGDEISQEDADNIHAYVIERAHKAVAEQASAADNSSTSTDTGY
jgi:mono/diheme cytochrome c family protein